MSGPREQATPKEASLVEVPRFAGNGRGTGRGGSVLGSHLTAGGGSGRAPPSPPWGGLAALGSEAEARVPDAMRYAGVACP